MKLVLGALVLALYGCAAKVPIGSLEPWHVAQVATLYRTEGKSLEIEQTWEIVPVRDKRFLCNGQWVVGCAVKSIKTIYISTFYGAGMFYAIMVHEYMHEILFKAGDPGWITWLDEQPLKGKE